MRAFDSDDVPEIDYPCQWTYKILGSAEADLRNAVREVVTGEYILQPSNTSKTGKYMSLELVLTVHTDDERRGIGQRLHAHRAVLYVF